MLARNPTGLRNLRIALVSTLVMLVLTGCDRIFPEESPLRIQQSRMVLRLAVCSMLDVDYILLESRGPGDPRWTKAWEAEGDLRIESGTVLESIVVPDGLVATSWTAFSGAGGDTIEVALRGEQPTVMAQFMIPDGGLPSEQWLEVDGSLHETPC